MPTLLPLRSFSYVSSKNFTKSSFSGYSFSSAEKWQIKRYQKIREELMSRDPKNIKAKEEEKYSIDTLVTKLGSELEDFKKEWKELLSIYQFVTKGDVKK